MFLSSRSASVCNFLALLISFHQSFNFKLRVSNPFSTIVNVHVPQDSHESVKSIAGESARERYSYSTVCDGYQKGGNYSLYYHDDGIPGHIQIKEKQRTKEIERERERRTKLISYKYRLTTITLDSNPST